MFMFDSLLERHFITMLKVLNFGAEMWKMKACGRSASFEDTFILSSILEDLCQHCGLQQ